VPAKKNKRGSIVEESSSAAQGGAQQNYVSPFGGILAPPSYYGGVPMQIWGSGAAMPPPNFAVPDVAFAEPYAHLPQPQQKCGHHWWIRCEKHAKYHMHPNQCKPTPCSLGLSATSQQYFSLRTNQPSATSQQYFSLRTNQQQPSATSQTNRLQMGEGNANITYELGRLHLAPPGQFKEGAVQSYYQQGYNNQDYQYQPPTED
jgi:hypothetical protein